MRDIILQIKRLNRLIVLCVLMCIALLGCGKDTAEYFSREDELSTEKLTVVTEKSPDGTEELEKEQYIYVYVCGHVNESGVYRFSEDERICDAIERAGGFSKQASTDYWNLAEKLSDGERIYVPTKAEAKKLMEAEKIVPEVDSAEKDAGSDARVNINTASKEELMTLSGIGEARALGIINYRTENGGFNSVDDITNVSGIGKALFANIKDYITI